MSDEKWKERKGESEIRSKRKINEKTRESNWEVRVSIK